jgi:hypothetical protein
MARHGLGLLNLIGLVGIGIYYLVLFLWPVDYSNPTREFYLADYADAFNSASSHYFLEKSTEVYEKSHGKSLGGLQIVNATYRGEKGSSIAPNKTELFRKWKIGENDMGLLLLYSYEIDGSGQLQLSKSEAEIGYRLSGYLSAGAIGSIFDESIGQVKDRSDLYSLQLAQAKAYAHILEHVLPDAYAIAVTPFDEAAYQSYQENYAGPTYGRGVPLNALEFAFSSQGNLWFALGFPLLFLGGLLLGDGAMIIRGKGGSSGGAGITRLFH